MKRNTRKNFIVFAVFVTLVTLIVVASTYAKYTSTFAGTGAATVAKWSFKVNGSETEAMTDVTLEDGTVNGKVADDRIAPGTDGGIGIALDATGSEVAINYTIEISNIQNKPTNLKFYNDAGFTDEATLTEGKYVITGTIALADVGTVLNVPLYWQWAYETPNAENPTGDTVDTTEGKAAATMTFDINITGTQADPRVA